MNSPLHVIATLAFSRPSDPACEHGLVLPCQETLPIEQDQETHEGKDEVEGLWVSRCCQSSSPSHRRPITRTHDKLGKVPRLLCVVPSTDLVALVDVATDNRLLSQPQLPRIGFAIIFCPFALHCLAQFAAIGRRCGRWWNWCCVLMSLWLLRRG